MAILYGAEKEDAEREMSEILDFEIKLANVRRNKLKFFLSLINLIKFCSAYTFKRRKERPI